MKLFEIAEDVYLVRAKKLLDAGAGELSILQALRHVSNLSSHKAELEKPIMSFTLHWLRNHLTQKGDHFIPQPNSFKYWVTQLQQLGLDYPDLQLALDALEQHYKLGEAVDDDSAAIARIKEIFGSGNMVNLSKVKDLLKSIRDVKAAKEHVKEPLMKYLLTWLKLILTSEHPRTVSNMREWIALLNRLGFDYEELKAISDSIVGIHDSA